ncbi:hypothetical protein I0C86_15565 [Plantactinospora sp. S1510]|uniref:ABC-2 type transport system permease protein n=1 Tax=Plantactinospora alkalitolerans TaxID=2789879 RepID=A0ABS0GWA9_9ACTN|nr:hypothetical protein [Plantactinospora alkalitolerans]MBF9130364.1 hypothetical protein [Plantactinospora alkalitolerans]
MSAVPSAPGPLAGALGKIAVPARMRTAMLRRSLREHPGPTVAGLAGLLAAGWLIRYALHGDRHTLALLAGAWVLGWIVLPLLLGGGRGRVRPAHLRLESIGGFPAAIGLLAASAIGIGPVVSLVALAALPVYAARYGPVAVLVTAAGAVLLWLLGLIGSAIALEVVGHAGGPAGALLTGIFTGTALGVAGSLWAVFPWVSVLLVGAPDEVVRAMAYVPSGWPLSAVAGPADRGAEMMAGLAGVVVLVAAAYVLLVRRMIAAGVPFRPRGITMVGLPRRVDGEPAGSPRTTAASTAGAGPERRGWSGRVPAETRAVAGRELRAWLRHPLRLQYLAFAVVYGALLAGLPLMSDVALLLPWAGPFAVLGAAAMSAGLVGLDGTALWLPFTSPGGERAEVRGRALAWLLLVTPIGVLLTVAGIVLAPEVDPLAALATLPALLGAGASVPVWVSLLRVRPVADPRHPTSADNPTDIVSVLVATGGGLLAGAPVLALLIWGPSEVAPLMLPVGLLCGAVAWWAGIWLADDRLAQRGTEVLAAAGQRSRPPDTVIPLKWDVEWYRENRATAWALGLLTVGWIPVIPQGVMVLAFGIDGGWIVASHLAGGARTAVGLGMVALGGAMLLAGLVLWGRRPQPGGSPRTSRPASATTD